MLAPGKVVALVYSSGDIPAPMNRVLFFITFLAPIIALTMIASKKGDINKTFKGVAMDFHDPVAYHTIGRASKGQKSVRTEHNGAFYHFISHSNMQLFKESPRSYLPAYGGYCAYGVSIDGSRKNVDPAVWEILDGRLYLFEGQKERTEFGYKSREYIQQANINWLE